MPSKHRNFLTYKGQPIASVDVKNSQPYFSTVTTKPSFWIATASNSFSIKSLGTKINKELELDSLRQDKSVITLLNTEETQAGKGFQHYIDLAVRGQLYEYLSSEYLKLAGINISDRKKLKEFVFQTFFTDNRFISHPDAAFKRLFKELFPDVYHLFYLIKKGKKNKLAVLLQVIESHLMLEVVCKRISRERPKLFITTIHDSIATTVGNEYYVESVIKEELQKTIGYRPSTAIEYWAPENVRFKDGSYFIRRIQAA
jgi:hypothetical protein